MRFHGGLPGRGPNTWWKFVCKNRLFHSRYIYEFDMSKYFETLDLEFITKALRALKVPEKLIHLISSMIKDHRDNLEKGERMKEEAMLSMSRKPKQFQIMQDVAKFMMAYQQQGIDFMKASPKRDVPFKPGNGIPQGLSFSPLLSLIAAWHFMNNCVHKVTPETLSNSYGV